MSNSNPERSSQSITDDGEGGFVAISIPENNNQYRKDFPDGVHGTYSHKGNQVVAEFEMEGAEPMGTRNVPRCLAGDFETEFNGRGAFGSSFRLQRVWKASKNLNKADNGNAGDGWVTEDGKPILLRMEKRKVEDEATRGTRELHALLDTYFRGPDPNHRQKRVQKLRDEHPEIYQEHFGDDVANDKAAVPKSKSKAGRRRCQIQ